MLGVIVGGRRFVARVLAPPAARHEGLGADLRILDGVLAVAEVDQHRRRLVALQLVAIGRIGIDLGGVVAVLDRDVVGVGHRDQLPAIHRHWLDHVAELRIGVAGLARRIDLGIGDFARCVGQSRNVG